MRRASLAVFCFPSALAALLSVSAASADPGDLPPPLAYNYGENETARTAGLGGASRAFATGQAALYQNPSGMVSTRIYHLDALVQVTPEVGRQVYAGSIVDSVTGRLAGGIAVAGGIVDPDGLHRSFLDARIGLALPVTEIVSVGAAARYAKITQTGLGPLGESKASGGLVDPEGGRSPLVNTFSFDAGLTVRLGDFVHLAVVGQNLSYPNHGLLPTTLGGGLGYAGQEVTIEVDGVADFNSYEKTSGRFMVGGEYLFGGHIPLRLGYGYDQGAGLHALSAGLGYIGEEFSIDASLRRTLSDPGATTVVIGLGYFLESSGLTRAPQGME